MPEEYEPLIRLFKRQSGAFPYANNKVRMFVSGAEMLDNLLRDIAAARHHVHVETYIIEDDTMGRAIQEALIKKAKEGVNVRLIYDDVGCWSVSKRFFKKMKQ